MHQGELKESPMTIYCLHLETSRFEKRKFRGGRVVVKVSRVSFSNLPPVSSGANAISYCCANVDTEMRRLNMAKFFPGQLYGPR